MVSVLSGNFQSKVEDIVNKAISTTGASISADCYNEWNNKISFLVDNSDLEISGSVILKQQAMVTFACVQKQDMDASFVQAITNKIKDDIEQEVEAIVGVGSFNISNIDREIENIVQNSVDLVISSNCTFGGGASSDIRMKDSRVSVGNCARHVAAGNTETCLNGQNSVVKIVLERLKQGITEEPSRFLVESLTSTCPGMRECAQRAGDFIVEQDVTVTAGCDQSQKMAIAISQLVTNELETILKQSTKASLIPTELVWIIIAGAIAVAVIGGIAAFLKYQSDKNKKEKQQWQAQPGRRSVPVPYQRLP